MDPKRAKRLIANRQACCHDHIHPPYCAHMRDPAACDVQIAHAHHMTVSGSACCLCLCGRTQLPLTYGGVHTIFD